MLVWCACPYHIVLEEKVPGREGMQLSEINSKDLKHISDEVPVKMSEKEKDDYIHKLELKTAVLEGTVKIVKIRGIEGESNDGKATLVDTLKKRFTIRGAFCSRT